MCTIQDPKEVRQAFRSVYSEPCKVANYEPRRSYQDLRPNLRWICQRRLKNHRNYRTWCRQVTSREPDRAFRRHQEFPHPSPQTDKTRGLRASLETPSSRPSSKINGKRHKDPRDSHAHQKCRIRYRPGRPIWQSRKEGESATLHLSLKCVGTSL